MVEYEDRCFTGDTVDRTVLEYVEDEIGDGENAGPVEPIDRLHQPVTGR
jgi:hypothetical protein